MTVRQRQIELEKQMSDVTEDADKTRDMHELVEGLLRRISRLEETLSWAERARTPTPIVHGTLSSTTNSLARDRFPPLQ
jgi:hypothetical protein